MGVAQSTTHLLGCLLEVAKTTSTHATRRDANDDARRYTCHTHTTHTTYTKHASSSCRPPTGDMQCTHHADTSTHHIEKPRTKSAVTQHTCTTYQPPHIPHSMRGMRLAPRHMRRLAGELLALAWLRMAARGVRQKALRTIMHDEPMTSLMCVPGATCFACRSSRFEDLPVWNGTCTKLGKCQPGRL